MFRTRRKVKAKLVELVEYHAELENLKALQTGKSKRK